MTDVAGIINSLRDHLEEAQTLAAELHGLDAKVETDRRILELRARVRRLNQESAQQRAKHAEECKRIRESEAALQERYNDSQRQRINQDRAIQALVQENKRLRGDIP
jgi:DNA anti-recombination protein RmuC